MAQTWVRATEGLRKKLAGSLDEAGLERLHRNHAPHTDWEAARDRT
ncbi:MAG: hypothetical protein JXQ83_07845 [Candidatus Glassbacteria bacterium]|nr:hypothetical protein [Candidatus Glassbacteria bacterium]